MRYSQAEKMEIIKMVEGSPLSVKQTLKEFNINRSTFYNWYGRYQEHGYDGLANTYNPPRQFWNEIPPWERQRVVDMALEHQDKSPRQLAWYITDSTGYYISESTVYRILKDHDLVTSPLYTLISAHEKFPKPTKVVNELWQTDFTFLKVVHWGWYYLSIDIVPYEMRDIENSFLLELPEHFSKNSWICQNICDENKGLPFKDKEFDFAICGHVLEDIANPFYVIKELQRVAKRGYIEVPSRFYEQYPRFHKNRLCGDPHHRWIIDLRFNPDSNENELIGSCPGARPPAGKIRCVK